MPNRYLMSKSKEAGLGWQGKQVRSVRIPNIVREDVSKTRWEKIVKQVARDKHEEDLKEEVGSKTKLEGIKD